MSGRVRNPCQDVTGAGAGIFDGEWVQSNLCALEPLPFSWVAPGDHELWHILLSRGCLTVNSSPTGFPTYPSATSWLIRARPVSYMRLISELSLVFAVKCLDFLYALSFLSFRFRANLKTSEH